MLERAHALRYIFAAIDRNPAIILLGNASIIVLTLNPTMIRFVLGLVAVVVLICAITEFRVDWCAVAGRHCEAVSRLAALKAKYRKTFAETGGDDPKKNARLTSEYDKTVGSLQSRIAGSTS